MPFIKSKVSCPVSPEAALAGDLAFVQKMGIHFLPAFSDPVCCDMLKKNNGFSELLQDLFTIHFPVQKGTDAHSVLRGVCPFLINQSHINLLLALLFRRFYSRMSGYSSQKSRS